MCAAFAGTAVPVFDVNSVLVALETTGAFAALSAPLRVAIAEGARTRRFGNKQILFRANAEANALYVIIAGNVRVSRERAGQSALLHTETAGGILGEIPLF